MFWLKIIFSYALLSGGPASVYKQISEETTILMKDGKRVKLQVMVKVTGIHKQGSFRQGCVKFKDF